MGLMKDDSHGEERQRPRGLRAWLRHAFAVEKYEESSLSDADKRILRKIAGQIHERRLTAAAILWIQSNRHMGWLTSQALVMFGPIFDMTHTFFNAFSRNLGLYISPADFPKLHAALEKRYSIEYFIQQLEAHAAGDYNMGSPEQQASPAGDDDPNGSHAAGDASDSREDTH